MEKICRTCKKEQDICNFKKNPMYKDGYETQCKTCQKEIKKKKLIENDNIPKHKVCRICLVDKDISLFGINKAYKDGYDSMCKTCRNKKAKIQQDKHRENINKKYVERYHADEEFKKHRLEMGRKSSRKSRLNNPEKWMLSSAKARAKEKGWDFNLDESDIIIPEYCPILEIKLLPGGVGKQTFNSPSLDRIDSTKGYVKGNVRVISLRANMMKNDANLKELEKFNKNIINYMNSEDIVRTTENGESVELKDKEPLG